MCASYGACALGRISGSSCYVVRTCEVHTFDALHIISAAPQCRYDLGEKIGKGASCTVHVATDRQTGERCAGMWQLRHSLANLACCAAGSVLRFDCFLQRRSVWSP